jgi:hypothetical protein
MKITKTQLKQIIKEELEAHRQGLEEAGLGDMLKKIKDLGRIMTLSPEAQAERDAAIVQAYEDRMGELRAKLNAAKEEFGNESEEARAVLMDMNRFVKQSMGR